jgi:hypothetical protein
MAKGPKRAAAPFFKPTFIVAAAAMIWGAQHPPGTADLGALGGWALGMLTVGLLVRAALAVAVPALALLGVMLRQSLRAIQAGREER